MFVHIPTGRPFENRKAAKKYFGLSDYNRRVKNNEFTRHDGIAIVPKEEYKGA